MAICKKCGGSGYRLKFDSTKRLKDCFVRCNKCGGTGHKAKQAMWHLRPKRPFRVKV